MQRTLVALTMLGALLGQVQQSQAQGPKIKKAQVTKAGNKDSSHFVTKEKDSATIELSPVAVPVAYQANHYISSAPDYPRLQTPLLSGFGSQELSDEVKAQVKTFISNYYQANNKHLQNIQAKSSPYFSVMAKVFDKFGLPEDLKYLAVIESGLNTHARSRVGAVGAWQFMASTARLLGLKVNAQQDDRKDLYKSTVAAAKYLSELHGMFGNWMLVIAAYNCGPGRLQQAISSSGSTNFWELKKFLPQESQKHVMKFLATSYIMDRFADFFGVDKKDIQLGLVRDNNFSPIEQPLANITISGKYSMAVIAEYISMDLMQLEQLNPGLIDKLSTDFSKTHNLFLPADKMILFKASQNKILNESITLLAQNNNQKEK